MTKKLPLELKLARKATRVACEFCHSKHLQCDDTRPCQNCTKRGFQGTCKDSVRKRKTAYKTRSKKKADPSTDEGEPRVKKPRLPRKPKQDGKPRGEILLGSNDTVDLQLKIDSTSSSTSPGIAVNKPLTNNELISQRSSSSEDQTTSSSSSTSPRSKSEYESQSQDTQKEEVQNTSQVEPAPSITPLLQPLLSNSISYATLPNSLNAATGVGDGGLKTPTLSQINLTNAGVFTPPNPYNPDLRTPTLSSALQFKAPRTAPTSYYGNDHSTGFVQTAGQHMFYPGLSVGNKLIANDEDMESSSKEATITPTATSDVMSTNSSTAKNFESTMANDEYVQLTDLLNTNPPSPSEGFFFQSDNESMDSEIYGVQRRPFIEINIKENIMISSYPSNSTPNSYVYNDKHSKISNTARVIPTDLQDDPNYTSPLIMRHVIKTPDDIYLTNIVKAYRYPTAYHALISYLKQRFNQEQLIEIAKCMAKYRPSFISATKNLFENDLIFTERSFQRTLLEYETLISLSPSPTIIWRRTGEIVALTNEFAVMTGYSKMSLLSKRTFIVELFDDESTIKYFKSFSAFAFGDLNATHLTDCSLRKAEDDDYLRCTCVWTIKRDVFDIPMLIVGQFLPVLD